VQLVQRLRDQDPEVTPALVWLDENCAARCRAPIAWCARKHQRQGASNVTVRNIITSMRLMSDVDWAEFFESVSLVDEALNLRRISRHGFRARAILYRNAIEELARGSPLSELEIAPPCSTSATAHRARQRDPVSPHRRGPPQLGTAIGLPARAARLAASASLHRRRARTTSRPSPSRPRCCWRAAGAACNRAGVHGAMLWLLGCSAPVPALDIAGGLGQPRGHARRRREPLPGLALRDGSTRRAAHAGGHAGDAEFARLGREHLHHLEIHYLASPDDQLHFALLPTVRGRRRRIPARDEALLGRRHLGIARLNRRYGPAGGWRALPAAASQARLVRERAALDGLGAQARQVAGAESAAARRTNTTYVTSTGKSPWVPGDVRYVLTLDADTRVPRETPRRLIGKMAQPR
jgi:cyclic beta-1,2-glucan synthetase